MNKHTYLFLLVLLTFGNKIFSNKFPFSNVKSYRLYPQDTARSMDEPLVKENLLTPYWKNVKDNKTQEEKDNILRYILKKNYIKSPKWLKQRILIAAAVAAGANPNTESASKLKPLISVPNNDYGLTEFLLENKADPNSIVAFNDHTAPVLLSTQKVPMAKLLLRYKANIEARHYCCGSGALHWAMIPEADAELILIYNIPDLNKPDLHKEKPIHYLADESSKHSLTNMKKKLEYLQQIEENKNLAEEERAKALQIIANKDSHNPSCRYLYEKLKHGHVRGKYLFRVYPERTTIMSLRGLIDLAHGA